MRRAATSRALLIYDFGYPAIYGFTLTTVLAYLLRVIWPVSFRSVGLVALLPAFAAVFDALENATMYVCLGRDPDILTSLLPVSRVATMLKITLLVAGLPDPHRRGQTRVARPLRQAWRRGRSRLTDAARNENAIPSPDEFLRRAARPGSRRWAPSRGFPCPRRAWPELCISRRRTHESSGRSFRDAGGRRGVGDEGEFVAALAARTNDGAARAAARAALA
jgi:hypothetical protein